MKDVNMLHRFAHLMSPASKVHKCLRVRYEARRSVVFTDCKYFYHYNGVYLEIPKAKSCMSLFAHRDLAFGVLGLFWSNPKPFYDC